MWTVTYFLLLIYAICFTKGVGSPLAYPGGILTILIACSLLGLSVFAPAAGMGRIFCLLTGLPRLAAIPVVTVSALGLTYLMSLFFSLGFLEDSTPSFSTILKNYTLFLSLPLGAYWWLTEGPGALIDTIRRLVASHKASTAIKPAHIALK